MRPFVSRISCGIRSPHVRGELLERLAEDISAGQLRLQTCLLRVRVTDLLSHCHLPLQSSIKFDGPLIDGRLALTQERFDTL